MVPLLSLPLAAEQEPSTANVIDLIVEITELINVNHEFNNDINNNFINVINSNLIEFVKSGSINTPVVFSNTYVDVRKLIDLNFFSKESMNVSF
jgi:hypothetical protein